MKNNLVSVLIPSFNHENYVQETINSIINQTYQNLELIVIDDGSKDSSWQKICEMEDICKKRFSNVIFETKVNEGACATLNSLIEKANGEYIYIIASDDTAIPTAIEKEINFLANNPDYALCVGDNAIMDSNSKPCFWDKKRNIVYDVKKAKYKTFGEYLQKSQKLDFSKDYFGSYSTIYPRNYIPNGYLIRKSIFEKIGSFTKEAPLEDYWLMLQISKYAKMKYINEVLFNYRWHATNTIKQKEKIGEYIDKTRKYENKLLEKIDFSNVLPDVKDFCKNGAVYRVQTFLCFTREVRMLPYKKIYSYKIFGITFKKKYKIYNNLNK